MIEKSWTGQPKERDEKKKSKGERQRDRETERVREKKEMICDNYRIWGLIKERNRS
jgi:hypothetical protein